jgi:hypothetical protein
MSENVDLYSRILITKRNYVLAQGTTCMNLENMLYERRQKVGMMAHTYNPSTLETKDHEFWASLGRREEARHVRSPIA